MQVYVVETGNIIIKSNPMDVCRNKVVIVFIKSNHMYIYVVEANW